MDADISGVSALNEGSLILSCIDLSDDTMLNQNIESSQLSNNNETLDEVDLSISDADLNVLQKRRKTEFDLSISNGDLNALQKSGNQMDIDLSISDADLNVQQKEDNRNELQLSMSDVDLNVVQESENQSELDLSISDADREALQKRENQSELDLSISDPNLDVVQKTENLAGLNHEKHLRTIVEEDISAISVLDETEEIEQTPTTNGESSAQSLHLMESCNDEVEEKDEHIALSDERAYFQRTLFELGRRLWKSSLDEQHYTKGCLWSPDGTCLLVPVHLDGMHVMELPRDLYNIEQIDVERELSELPTAVHVKEGGTVYDLVWYPFMNSEAPESCCWLATRQHEPIHLWDAFTGELRCTYRGYDDVDEVEAAISVAFSNDGDKVIGGYKKNIKVFDTNTPGRDYMKIPVKKAISCFALTQDSDLTVTTGSWYGYIDHYDLRAPKFGSLFTLKNHTGGITWLKYSKKEPLMLYSGARRDNQLLQWDMRNYKEPVRNFERNVTTNQRIYFDLSPQEEWLVSGSSDGLLRIWDLTQSEPEAVTVPVHNDCCNGVHFHPTLPILATSSGQYHFVDVEGESNEPTIVQYENSTLIFGLNSFESNGTQDLG